MSYSTRLKAGESSFWQRGEKDRRDDDREERLRKEIKEANSIILARLMQAAFDYISAPADKLKCLRAHEPFPKLLSSNVNVCVRAYVYT